MTQQTEMAFSEEDAKRLSEAQRKYLLWARGELAAWKLTKNQQESLRKLRSCEADFLLCTRRYGKTRILVTYFLEECLRQKVSTAILAQSFQAVVRFVLPVFRELLSDCPLELRPKFNGSTFVATFPNGSVLKFQGTDKVGDDLRGQTFNLVAIDEAGFHANFTNLVNEVVRPMLLSTNGRLIFASTPPKTSEHPFVNLTLIARGRGRVVHRTINDVTYLPRPVVDAFIAESAESLGLAPETYRQTPAYRREYLAEFTTDTTFQVVPEANFENQSTWLAACERPPFWDCYVSLDPGFVDCHGVVYAYWDFRKAKLVVEDETLMRGANTAKLAAAIASKEEALWGGKKPILRVMDTNRLAQADLADLHELNFSVTRKDGLEEAINALRVAFARGQVVIHPRCAQLTAQLIGTTWNAKRTRFEVPDGQGHADLLMALVYLWRNVDRGRNPYPAHFGLPIHDTVPSREESTDRVLKDLMFDWS